MLLNTILRLQAYGNVIGVSKRCCPACSHFLDLLAQQHVRRLGEGHGNKQLEVIQPFRVRGSHSNVSGCTLPLWTPSHIVDDMNATFGSHLRKALVTLMPAAPFRSRRNSGGSQTLSINSAGKGSNKAPSDTQSFTSFEGINPGA